MTVETLQFIANELKKNKLSYSYIEWTATEVPDPYFVGEYAETEPTSEDGMCESTFIITGFSRSTWLSLEQAKERIKKLFPPVIGKTVIHSNGTGAAVFYAYSFPVPVDDISLKKIQINLTIKEWSV